MKIIFLLDQIQAGLGGKEHGDQPLGGQKTAIGSVKMFEKLLKQKEIDVLATIYCGDDYYLQNPKESSLKIAAMAQKLGADAVLCDLVSTMKSMARWLPKQRRSLKKKYRSQQLPPCRQSASRQLKHIKTKSLS